MNEIVAISLGVISLLGFGVISALLQFHHRQQAIRFWEREKRLPDATRFENLKVLAEQEEARLQELRDRLFEARNTIEEAERLRKWMEDSRADREKLEFDRLEIVRVQAELSRLQTQLAELIEQKKSVEEQLSKARQAFEAAVEEERRRRREAEQISEQVKEQAALLQKYQQELLVKREELSQLGEQQELLSRQLEKSKKELAGLEEELERRVEKQERQFEEHRRQLQRDLDNLKGQREELNQAVTRLKQEEKQLKEGLERLRGEANSIRLEKQALEAAVAEARSQSAVMQQALDTLSTAVSGQGGGSAEKSAEDLWVPALSTPEKGLATEADELDYLKTFRNDLAALGLKFHERTINAFHTSLKTTLSSPLIVLAGVSGTGKSELPRRYAESFGINFLNLAVQPRWDSPQDLFGFYDYLEQRFRPSELTRALIQMDRFRGEGDRGWLKSAKELQKSDRSREMLLVLLDEMNLARIEYYFSEFLSRLETRRGIDPSQSFDRRKSEISIDIGGRRGTEPMRIFVDANVLFVGTMNEDETTQALSDKVIDRANILRFGSPATIARPSTTKKKYVARQERLGADVWSKQWVKTTGDLDSRVRDQLMVWIESLRKAMDSIQRPFAYRVSQGILEYAANYPNAADKLGWIISDQIEQKILPKLRGVDPTDPKVRRAFDVVFDVLKHEEVKDELLIEHLQRSNNDNYFQWTGLDRAREAELER
jgi:predicted  nucleic acid-binding Zn-ribbon protein